MEIIFVQEQGDGADRDATASEPARRSAASLTLRAPEPVDGPAVSALIGQCPPLDPNSAYCNLLQCAHFADSCIIAERQGKVIGWISGYRLPSDPARFFVWQVAVHADARGEGLARKMLDALLGRPVNAAAKYVLTTVTEANDASWALFESFARSRDARLIKTPLFEKHLHFAGKHETEWQAEIGPFRKSQANGD